MEKIFIKGFLVKDRGSEVDKKKTLKLKDPNTEGGKTLKNETKSVSQSFEDKRIIETKTQGNQREDICEDVGGRIIMTEFPGELLEHIFKFLDPNTIKNAVCVSKKWKRIMETTSLWKWARAKMFQPNTWEKGRRPDELYGHSLQQIDIVRSNRFKFIEEINLIETKQIRRHMNEIVVTLQRKDNLKTVVLEVGKGSKIDPENLAKLVSSTENFELSECHEDELEEDPGNSVHFIPAIMNELVSNNQSKTKWINTSGYILLDVEPDLFSRGAMKLDKLTIQDVGMTEQQGEKLFEYLATEGSASLKELDLKVILTNIRPDFIDGALGKLKKLALNEPEMSVEQFNMMFCKMNTDESALESLSLTGCDFEDEEHFRPEIVVNGFLNLTELTLSYTQLSIFQTMFLFVGIATRENLKLRKLNLGRHPLNAKFSYLRVVHPKIFAKAICNLKEADVQYNNLSYDQMNALFERMIENQHCLETLAMSYKKQKETETQKIRRECLRYDDDQPIQHIDEALISKALLTVKDIEFQNLSARYLHHFIESIKVAKNVKTRYLVTHYGSKRCQRMLEEALAQNEHINYAPHRTLPKMLDWGETTPHDIDNWSDEEDEEEEDDDEDDMDEVNLTFDMSNPVMRMQLKFLDENFHY